MTHIMIDGYPVKRYFAADSKSKSQGDGLHDYRELTQLLIKMFGVCYFCGTPVRVYPQIDGEPQKPDQATIDHLKSRKYRKRGEIVEKVLACYGCNYNRNEEEQNDD